jgi:glycine/D-amino acid oxidase-like deaminating enzyme
VWAAGGYCGTGNVIGAMAGRALAEMVAGQHSAAGELLK